MNVEAGLVVDWPLWLPEQIQRVADIQNIKANRTVDILLVPAGSVSTIPNVTAAVYNTPSLIFKQNCSSNTLLLGSVFHLGQIGTFIRGILKFLLL